MDLTEYKSFVAHNGFVVSTTIENIEYGHRLVGFTDFKGGYNMFTDTKNSNVRSDVITLSPTYGGMYQCMTSLAKFFYINATRLLASRSRPK